MHYSALKLFKSLIKRPAFILTFVCSLGNFAYAQDSFRDQLKVYDRDDIHSIHKKLYTKEGRHEFTLGLGGILNNDGYALTLGQYTYHLFENLGIEAAAGGLGFQFNGAKNKLYFFQSSIAFSPLYGKLSLFTWAVLNFDIYAIGGAGVVRYTGLKDGSSFMGNFGIGQRLFINEYLSVKLEFRDYIYNQNLPATNNSRILHNYSLMAGLSLFMPFRSNY
ncbi:MAG: outer membrane beta-barrel domain-containing protein [Deltaproteobacteria bacterium]|nr:outer membrane beta-barrel domain-containing protein [Deltaproteobacteria bacterium]